MDVVITRAGGGVVGAGSQSGHCWRVSSILSSAGSTPEPKEPGAAVGTTMPQPPHTLHPAPPQSLEIHPPSPGGAPAPLSPVPSSCPLLGPLQAACHLATTTNFLETKSHTSRK